MTRKGSAEDDVALPLGSFPRQVSYLGHEIHDRQLYIFLEYMPEGARSVGTRSRLLL